MAMDGDIPENVMPLLAERDKLERMLLGAIQSALAAGATLGPEVSSWWSAQPSFIDEIARRAVLSISSEEYSALTAYVKNHKELPGRD